MVSKIARRSLLESNVNTGVYLSVLQYERLKTMAAADSRSASNFIGLLIDEAWNRYLAQKEDSPLPVKEPA